MTEKESALVKALVSLLFIAYSHHDCTPVCTCATMKPGFTCPYCEARKAIVAVGGRTSF